MLNLHQRNAVIADAMRTLDDEGKSILQKNSAKILEECAEDANSIKSAVEIALEIVEELRDEVAA